MIEMPQIYLKNENKVVLQVGSIENNGKGKWKEINERKSAKRNAQKESSG